MYIIGISAYYHDAAAALIKDGEIIGAVQEERFSRIKHDPALPIKSVQYLLQKEGLQHQDIEYWVFYESFSQIRSVAVHWPAFCTPLHMHSDSFLSFF